MDNDGLFGKQTEEDMPVTRYSRERVSSLAVADSGLIVSTSLNGLKSGCLTCIPEYIQSPLNRPWGKTVKRIIDIAVSLAGIVFVLSWLTPLVALLIKLSSRGPVFFFQRRIGLGGKPFLCIKFRSMKVNTGADSQPALRNDPRVTAVGKPMRRCRADELPQLINVLKGEMALVGPRPYMVGEASGYARSIPFFSLRHSVKPGITGAGQLIKERPWKNPQEKMEYRTRADIRYIERWSLTRDLSLVLRTLGACLRAVLPRSAASNERT